MEEKERYEWNSPYDSAVRDNKNDDIINAIERLNEQDKRIKELEEELKNYKLCRCVDCSSEYEYGLETSIDELEKENQQLKQQLADYAKQVRKEVCDEIRKTLFEFLLTYDVITDKLDKLRG